MPPDEHLKATDEPALSTLEQIQHSAYQEALYQAWFSSSLEQTKSIFTLASAGVGLSLTLLFGLSPSTDTWAFGWLAAGCGLLALASIFCIWLFRANSKLVEKLIANDDESAADGLVGRLALLINIFFGLGLVFLVFAAFAKVLFQASGVK